MASFYLQDSFRNARFEDVLRLYKLKLTQNGSLLVGRCPLPGHLGPRSHDSFQVDCKRGRFQCSACGRKGDHFDFAVLMENLDPTNADHHRRIMHELGEALDLIKGEKATGGPSFGFSRFAPPRPTDQGFEPASLVNVPLKEKLSGLDPDHPYLAKRGFTRETVKLFGLGYCNHGYFAGRIVIPIYDSLAKLIGYAGRLVDEEEISPDRPKYVFSEPRLEDGKVVRFDPSLVLYHAQRAAKEFDNLMIVEGFASVWWMVQCNFRCVNTVALMGTSMSEEQLDTAIMLTKEHAKVFVWCDQDEAGIACARDIAERLAPFRAVRILSVPGIVKPTELPERDIDWLLRQCYF